MTTDTKQLIRQLTEKADRVRPLARPSTRAAAWLVFSVAYIVLVLLIMPFEHDISPKLHDKLFVIEQIATLATGVAAAIAAFASIIPGYGRRWIMLPLPPFMIWLASLGPGCVRELSQSGFEHLPLQHNLWCFPFIVLLGAIPATAMAAMLRRGAPLTPQLTAALGGLAAAGLANAGVRIIHPEDVSLMLLLWHVGSVMALSALAGSMGHYILNWRSILKLDA